MNEHEENQISLIPTPEDGMRSVYEETLLSSVMWLSVQVLR